MRCESARDLGPTKALRGVPGEATKRLGSVRDAWVGGLCRCARSGGPPSGRASARMILIGSRLCSCWGGHAFPHGTLTFGCFFIGGCYASCAYCARPSRSDHGAIDEARLSRGRTRRALDQLIGASQSRFVKCCGPSGSQDSALLAEPSVVRFGKEGGRSTSVRGQARGRWRRGGPFGTCLSRRA